MTTVVLNPTIDSYIDSSVPTTNNGSVNILYGGELSGASANTRILLKFDLSSIPANAIISSAVLSLYAWSDRADNTSTWFVYRLKRAWVENQVTWNQYASGNNWQTAGGLGSNDAETGVWVGSRSFSATETLNQFKDFNLTPTTKAGLDLGNGWIIAPTGADTGYVFYAREWGTAAQRPKLTITYTTGDVVASQAVGHTEAVTLAVQAPDPRVSTVTDSVTLTENVAFSFPDLFFDASRSDSILVSESQTLAVIGLPPDLNLVFSENITLVESNVFYIEANISVSDAVGVSEFRMLHAGTLISVSETVFVTDSPHSRIPSLAATQRFFSPLLYLTNGADKFDLLSKSAGYSLCNWDPSVAKYKNEGVFNDSPLATGRRLVFHEFQNIIESFSLSATAHSQDKLTEYTNELFRWLEAAASYWETGWSSVPIYLVARAPRETNTRYAVLHRGEVDKLGNPYSQPFTPRSMTPSYPDISLTLELSHWTDTPPGEGICVSLRSTQDWVPGGLQTTTITSGTIYSLIQANSGLVLAGTNDAAKIYSTVDNGTTWILVQTLGTSTDTVTAMAKDSLGNLYATVAGPGTGKGVWKSTDNGLTWVKVRTPSGAFAASTGYNDIAAKDIIGSVPDLVVAVGDGVSNQGFFEWSLNSGATWTTDTLNDITPSTDPLVAVAWTSYFTNEVSSWIISDTNPTRVILKLAGSPYPTSNQWVPPSTEGNFGQGGLDIIFYGIRYLPRNQDYSENMLAVKSLANPANTEIWTWIPPAFAAIFITSGIPGAGYWRKRSTIVGKTVRVLYADPYGVSVSGPYPTGRTIWAGTDAGEILVSHDTGYNWQVYSTLSSGGVKTILRTSGGAILFGGGITQILSQSTVPSNTVYGLGQSATCENAVYVANKSSQANLTHVKQFTNSSGTFVSLQFETSPPYTLFPTPPAFNDAVYFGVRTTLPDVVSNGFSSVVFDLVTPQSDILGVTWEYWNGSAWTGLMVQDNTLGFSNPGINSVHWEIPSGWSTTTVNGVLGYWMRARINSLGATPVSPIHSGTYIYTVNNAFAEIEEGLVGGTLPALSRMKWYNRADDVGSSVLAQVDRMLVGLRSYDRGPSFNAYLNISDVQTPFGFSVAKDSEGAWSNQVTAPTGRYLSVSFASAARLNGWVDLVTFTLNTTIARDFYGRFRVLIRCKRNAGTATNWRLRAKTVFGSGGGGVITSTAYVKTTSDWEVIDLGQISIPSTQVAQLQSNLSDQISIIVQGYATATGIGLSLYDLILIPLDEWAIDSQLPELAVGLGAEIQNGSFLDIDSISNLRAGPVTGLNRTNSDLVRSIYQTVSNGPAILQVGHQQRLWFFGMKYNTGPFWQANPFIAGSVQVYKQQRYLGLRGDE